jgi:hypothetical protein
VTFLRVTRIENSVFELEETGAICRLGKKVSLSSRADDLSSVHPVLLTRKQFDDSCFSYAAAATYACEEFSICSEFP